MVIVDCCYGDQRAVNGHVTPVNDASASDATAENDDGMLLPKFRAFLSSHDRDLKVTVPNLSLLFQQNNLLVVNFCCITVISLFRGLPKDGLTSQTTI